MRIARVIGSAVSTMKPDNIRGSKLLILRAATPSNELYGEPFVAVDIVSAGTGELVLVADGSAGRRGLENDDAPVDSVIMAILDSLEVEGDVTFRKH
jgi:ethanolamine utilization protein eutN/carboxysome structural protein ccml